MISLPNFYPMDITLFDLSRQLSLLIAPRQSDSFEGEMFTQNLTNST